MYSRSSSEGLGAFRRISMEDADPNLTRKRPRLDSGDEARRSMSPNEPTINASTSEHALQDHAHETRQNLGHSPPTQPDVLISPLTTTPSKVTLNIREAPASPSAELGARSHTPASGPEGGTESSPRGSSKQTGSPSPEVISVASTSPPRSPEIQIAEVEDIGNEPTETVWKPMRTVDHTKTGSLNGLARFPYSEMVGDPVRMITRVLDTMKDLRAERLPMLRDLAEWIENYLSRTQSDIVLAYDDVLRQQAFWYRLPSIFRALTAQKPLNYLVDEIRRSGAEDGTRLIHDLLSAFAALCAHLAVIDLHATTLVKDDPPKEMKLISAEYIDLLQAYLSEDLGDGGVEFWTILKETGFSDAWSARAMMIRRFHGVNMTGIADLTELTKTLMDFSTFSTNFIQYIQGSIRLIYALSRVSLRLKQRSNAHCSRELLENLVGEQYRFLTMVERIFEYLISKQSPVLSRDLNTFFLDKLPRILYFSTRHGFPLANTIADETSPVPTSLVPEERAQAAELAWKFKIWRLLILKGRMELRIQGVNALQSELITLYQKQVNPTGGKLHPQAPLAQYVSDLLLESKIVDYLLGPDSHIQLMDRDRTANIIGFLIVTQRYTELQTDIIWDCFIGSNDPRVRSAILHVMGGFVHVATYEICLYLISKLHTLGLRHFDSGIIAYASQLFEKLLRLSTSESGRDIDMPPYQLCLRLMREAAAADSASSVKEKNIMHFATNQFADLLQGGPSDADRRSIYVGCVEDIARKSDSATGSVAALCRLLAHSSTMEDIDWLAQHLHLPRLLIHDLDRIVTAAALHEDRTGDVGQHFVIRLNLVQIVIIYMADSIDKIDGKTLWNASLGGKAPNNQAREYAWRTLVDVARNCPSRNSYLDHCIAYHIQELDPSAFTEASLHFAKAITDYENRLEQQERAELSKCAQQSRGVDLLWHISLVAPSNTVEHQAIQNLVAYYLDIYTTQDQADAQTKLVESKVIERCIDQLTEAASSLRNPDLPVDNQAPCRQAFSRSLAVLNTFVHGLQRRPGYVSPRIYQQHSIRGKSVNIKYQAFDNHGKSNGIKSLDLGELNCGRELIQCLKKATGFSQMTIYVGGQRLDLNRRGEETLSELRLTDSGALMVRRISDSPPERGTEGTIYKSSLGEVVEGITKYFFQLYDLLGMEERLAGEVLRFLEVFPPHVQMVQNILEDKASIDKYFPTSNIYRTIYSVYVLKYTLSQALHNGNIDPTFITQGIHLTSEVLSRIPSMKEELNSFHCVYMSTSLTDCLLCFLKAGEGSDDRATIVSKRDSLIGNLFALLRANSIDPNDMAATTLVSTSFALIVELSARSEIIWNCTKDQPSFGQLLQTLLLIHANHTIRQDTLRGLLYLRDTFSLQSHRQALDLDQRLWSMIEASIPLTLANSSHSEPFYHLAFLVLQSTSEQSELDNGRLVSEWSQLLLTYTHDEHVGQNFVDWTLRGLACLLHHCIKNLVSRGEGLNDFFPVAKDIVSKHLLPDSSRLGGSAVRTTRLPTMSSETRRQLYSILVALSNSSEKLRGLLAMLYRMLPEDEDFASCSWGFAQPSEDLCISDDNWDVEPQKLIVSSLGYAGLRNLSNTCYMNSLIAQLFMNPTFRGFILQCELDESDESQKLLQQTQLLFACMQETVLKAVDTTSFVETIYTYEGKQVDIHIQMDVDEFFNLLFDRLEAQMLSEPDKKRFRGQYGGYLVQQIKSKECPHVSERIEPFSAIQCEIKGKAGLVDSLRAYVEGEIMAGDNKYSCTTCGTYVDAVKRACLQQIPDNLIFHLKRFDYDIMSNTRIKVNDKFSFPPAIDMAPYHIDHADGEGDTSKTDVFELVGILVHAGTAESGHYYSYVREEKPDTSPNASWIEFNDAEVAPFDFETIGDACYGGISDQIGQFGPFLKPYNAYMLFYRRRNIDNPGYQGPSPESTPRRVQLATDLQHRYALMNEFALRKLCLFDAAHLEFLKAVIERLVLGPVDTSDSDDNTAAEATTLCLVHLDRIYSRMKGCQGLAQIADLIRRIMSENPECSRVTLSWICNSQREALRNMLLRCPYMDYRKAFAKLMVNAIQIHGAAQNDQLPQTESGVILDGILEDFITRMRDLANVLHVHWRAWDEYFGLLADLASLGLQCAQLLLQMGFLQLCLEMMVLEHAEAGYVRETAPVYQRIANLIEKKRRYSFINVVELCSTLLQKVDLERRQPVDSPQNRIFKDDGVSILTEREFELIRSEFSPTTYVQTCVFLEKAIQSHGNKAAIRDILRKLLLAEDHLELVDAIKITLMEGFLTDPAPLALPFLDAALVFCEASPSKQSITQVLSKAASDVETIGTQAGAENLQFFKDARRLHNIVVKWAGEHFEGRVRNLASLWAPPLLTFQDAAVRVDTLEFLDLILFSQNLEEMDNEQKVERIQKAGRELAYKCLERLQQMIKSSKLKDPTSLEQIKRVIVACYRTFFDDDVDDDHRFGEHANYILNTVQDFLTRRAEQDVVEGWHDNESENMSDTESGVSTP